MELSSPADRAGSARCGWANCRRAMAAGRRKSCSLGVAVVVAHGRAQRTRSRSNRVHDLDLTDIDLRLRLRRKPEDDSRRTIAVYFLVSRNHDPNTPAEPVQAEDAGADAKSKKTSISLHPLISWVQAGHWQELDWNFAVEHAGEVWPCPVGCSDETFVLRVKGQSMEPRFNEGDLIFVDPHAEPGHKTFIVVRSNDSMEATFKQLIGRTLTRYRHGGPRVVQTEPCDGEANRRHSRPCRYRFRAPGTCSRCAASSVGVPIAACRYDSVETAIQ